MYLSTKLVHLKRANAIKSNRSNQIYILGGGTAGPLGRCEMITFSAMGDH